MVFTRRGVCDPPGLAQNAPIVRGAGYEVDMSASSGAPSAGRGRGRAGSRPGTGRSPARGPSLSRRNLPSGQTVRRSDGGARWKKDADARSCGRAVENVLTRGSFPSRAFEKNARSVHADQKKKKAHQVAEAEEHEAGRAPPVHVLPGLALDAGLDDDARALNTHVVRCVLRRTRAGRAPGRRRPRRRP
jgi:hypothetical protein